MKLSGKHNAYITIRVLRFPVVHVRTFSISVTNVDEVAIRRLFSLPFSLYFTKKRQESSFFVYIVVVVKRHLHQKGASSFIIPPPATLLIVRANQNSELLRKNRSKLPLIKYHKNTQIYRDLDENERFRKQKRANWKTWSYMVPNLFREKT